MYTSTSEVNNDSVNQILHHAGNLNNVCFINKSPSTNFILNQMSLVHRMESHFFQINSHIIAPSKPRFPKLVSFFHVLWLQLFLYISTVLYMCQTQHSIRPPCYGCSNHRTLHCALFSLSCYFLRVLEMLTGNYM